MSRLTRLTGGLLAVAMLSTNLSAGIITGTGAGFNIPDNSPGGITSDIVVSQNETVTDVEVTLSGLTHSWVGDVTATISNGSVTSSLFARVGDPGGTSGDASTFDGNYAFRDGGNDLWVAAGDAGFGAPVAVGDYQASGIADAAVSLATDFAGQSSAGTWTLFMKDAAQGDTGSLVDWSIQLTTSGGGGSSGAVPEPGSMTVFALCTGLGCFSCARRRRRRFVDMSAA